MSDASDSETRVRRLSDLANPTKFLVMADRILPWLAGAAFVVLAAGLYLGFNAPEDFQQGITVRIMYIHVPFAWLAMLCYSLMALSALGTLVWRHPLADVALKAAAPIGAVFTALALATGSIWGKPMWGTWWVWDARLTSVFVLFLMYLGILALTRAIDDPAKSARAAAIITLVGFINIPIIKFSVDWWNTLHQPASVFRLDGPTIDASMLWPLMVMAAGFTLLFLTLHLMAMRTEIYRRRVMAMRQIAARRAERRLKAEYASRMEAMSASFAWKADQSSLSAIGSQSRLDLVDQHGAGFFPREISVVETHAGRGLVGGNGRKDRLEIFGGVEFGRRARCGALLARHAAKPVEEELLERHLRVDQEFPDRADKGGGGFLA